MINQNDRKKKQAKVGLFGDYIDGADAMLVYGVDSDNEDMGISQKQVPQPQRKKSNSSKKAKEMKTVGSKAQLEKNVVVPDKAKKPDSKEDETED